MAIQIEIQEGHAQLLIDFYVGRLKVLRDEILDKERETKEITAIIQKLKRREPQLLVSNGISVDKSTYSDKWPWVKKVQFALENNGGPLTTKEIVDVLTELEPSFLFDRKRAVASVSSILSSKSGSDKEFVRIEGESGDFAYDIKKGTRSTLKTNQVEPPDDLPF